MVRRLLLAICAVLMLFAAVPAGAQTERAIDVIKVSGPLDERAIDFAVDTIADVASSSELIIVHRIKIDRRWIR